MMMMMMMMMMMTMMIMTMMFFFVIEQVPDGDANFQHSHATCKQPYVWQKPHLHLREMIMRNDNDHDDEKL